MAEHKRIDKIQQEYFEFWLSLLNKIPGDFSEKKRMVEKGYAIQRELHQALSSGNNLNEYYFPTILEIRTEINKRLK